MTFFDFSYFFLAISIAFFCLGLLLYLEVFVKNYYFLIYFDDSTFTTYYCNSCRKLFKYLSTKYYCKKSSRILRFSSEVKLLAYLSDNSFVGFDLVSF